jgi:hypothetical protein
MLGRAEAILEVRSLYGYTGIELLGGIDDHAGDGLGV